jgi:hypothetical protein
MIFEREEKMYRGAFSAIQIINMVVHSIFTLLFQIAIGLGIGWLAVEKWGAPSWAYVPLILLGTIFGFYSMITFLLSAMRSYERLEKERESRQKKVAYDKNAYADEDAEED